MRVPPSSRWLFLTAVALLAALLFAACSESEPAQDTATPPPVTTVPATPTSTSTPRPTTPTGAGLAVIQPAVDALLSGDAARIRPLIAFTPVPCKDNVEGFPQPPGCSLRPQGTLIHVFPASSCEGEYLLPGSLDLLLSQLKPATLSGAFEKQGAEADPLYPDGHYGVILKAKDGSGLGSYWGLDEDGKIVRYWQGCGATPGEIAKALLKDGRWVLAPQ